MLLHPKEITAEMETHLEVLVVVVGLTQLRELAQMLLVATLEMAAQVQHPLFLAHQ
jgi:hypothetical protein